MGTVSSMTGYGNVKIQTELGELNVDVRSVNSRFLDFSFRCLEEFRPFEPKIRELVASTVARGKVEVRFNLTASSAISASHINEQALSKLLSMQEQVLALAPNAAKLSVTAILQFEGILETPETDKEKFEESILAGVRDCLLLFKESRLREGEALKNVLLKYCGQIDALVDELEPKIPLILHTMKEKLVERLDEALTQTLSENSQISKEEINDRIRQEVTLYGIKIDVNEEMERLRTHVREVRRVLDKGGAVGRRLDFLMQELNREANTLGSKAASIDMTQTSVNLKLVIESMREQIQNLE